MAALIQAHKLAFSFDSTPIIKDASLTLNPGEFVGLIGPNGAGKTTLLKMLGGLLKTGEGDLILMDKPLASYTSQGIAQIVAHVPQSTAMDFAFTVRELVLMGRSPHLGRFAWEGSADHAIADSALARMNLSDLAGRFITTLSGGERQRAFIARALAQEPQVLLLDEPTANLDVRHQLDVLETVVRLVAEEGLGVVAALHDLSLAAQFCDRLILLDSGRVLVDDTPEAVLTPDYLEAVFGVRAQVYRDPHNDVLRLSLSRNGHKQHARVME